MPKFTSYREMLEYHNDVEIERLVDCVVAAKRAAIAEALIVHADC